MDTDGSHMAFLVSYSGSERGLGDAIISQSVLAAIKAVNTCGFRWQAGRDSPGRNLCCYSFSFVAVDNKTPNLTLQSSSSDVV